MELTMSDVLRDIHIYWKEILDTCDSPMLPLDVKQSIYAFDRELLAIAVRTSYPEELGKALQSDDEKLKMYYMQRIWYRYVDLLNGRTDYDRYGITLTNSSSVRELDVTIDSMTALCKEGVEYLYQIPDHLQNMTYANALDVAVAVSMLERRRPYCS